jgi:serine/threonine-protein kinase
MDEQDAQRGDRPDAPLPRLGPKYEVLGELGSGGMGSVFKARHVAIDRVRAVKVLKRELLLEDEEYFERFRREAMIASDLSHENIVRVFDFDFTLDRSPYITMELLEGQDLQQLVGREGALGWERTVELLSGVAEAIDRVHELGVVHRDLKPANLFLTTEGVVKILDFGISRMEQEGGALTGTGDILGTPLYMAPEQLRAEQVDARTDVYALAAVAYELVTGKRAVEATSPSLVVAEVLEKAPRLASEHVEGLPGHVVVALARGLDKNPKKRFATTSELVSALTGSNTVGLAETMTTFTRSPTAPKRWPVVVALAVLGLGAAAVGLFLAMGDGAEPSQQPRPDAGAAPRVDPESRPLRVAVLPFEHHGSEDKQSLTESLSGEITSQLARMEGLVVLSSNATRGYRDERPPMEQIKRDLQVDFVLEGGVTWSGEGDGATKIRISPRLVDVESQAVKWSSVFEEAVDKIVEVQRKICHGIASSLTSGDDASGAGAEGALPTKSHEAFQLYLEARYHLVKQNREDIEKAEGLLSRAVEIDPQFALAHAALGSTYTGYDNWDPSEEWEAKAFVEVETALKLDPDLPEALVAKADLVFGTNVEGSLEQSIRLYRRATEINPNYADAHNGLAMVLVHVGLLEEALESARRCLELNPFDRWAHFRIGQILTQQQDFAGALEKFRSLPKDFFPAFAGYQTGYSLVYLGELEQAEEQLEKVAEEYPVSVGAHSSIAILRALQGDEKGALEAIEIVDKGTKGMFHRHHQELEVGAALAVLGKPDEAMEWLESAAKNSFPCYQAFAGNPLLEKHLGDNPEFQKLLAWLKKRHEHFKSL